jgi:hypothetical protein
MENDMTICSECGRDTFFPDKDMLCPSCSLEKLEKRMKVLDKLMFVALGICIIATTIMGQYVSSIINTGLLIFNIWLRKRKK